MRERIYMSQILFFVLMIFCSCTTIKDITNRNLSSTASNEDVEKNEATVDENPGIPLKDILFGSGEISTWTSKRLKKILTRETEKDHYKAEVYPISDQVIRAEAREQSEKEMMTPDEAKKNLGRQQNVYKGQTCFVIKVSTLTIDTAKASNFIQKIEINGQLTPIEHHGHDSTQNYYLSKSNQRYDWWNLYTACSKNVLDLSNGFTLYVIPKVGGSALSMTWLPEYKGFTYIN
jgi:hypothetical protein